LFFVLSQWICFSWCFLVFLGVVVVVVVFLGVSWCFLVGQVEAVVAEDASLGVKYVVKALRKRNPSWLVCVVGWVD